MNRNGCTKCSLCGWWVCGDDQDKMLIVALNAGVQSWCEDCYCGDCLNEHGNCECAVNANANASINEQKRLLPNDRSAIVFEIDDPVSDRVIDHTVLSALVRWVVERREVFVKERRQQR